MATVLLPPLEGELCHSLVGSLATPERFLRRCYSYLKNAHLKVLKGHHSSSASIIARCHCTPWHAAPLPPARPRRSRGQPPGQRGPAPDPVLGLVCLVPSRWWCAEASAALTGVGRWAWVPHLFCCLQGERPSDQIRSVAQSCPTLCDPMNRSTPGLPVHHQLPEFTGTHVH